MSQQTRKLRQARRERAQWTRRIALAVAFVGFAAAVPSMFRGMENRKPAAAAREPRLVVELREALTRMQTALLPAQRKAAAARIARRIGEFEPLIATILAQPQSPMFLGAAPLAAELSIDGALETLVSVLPRTKAEARCACLLAIDTLEPLDDTEVEDLLKDIDNRVVRTGLQIAARREPLPASLVTPVLDTLRIDDPAVRAQALLCLPPELSDDHVGTVLSLVDEFPEDPGYATLLSRIAPTPKGAERLLSHLESGDETVIERLAPVLQRYAAEPEIRTSLWSIAMSNDPMQRRASALYCLELAGVREGFPSLTSDWPPQLQLHLARLRLGAGQLAGVDALLELAFTDAAGDRDMEEASGRARLLLGRLAEMPPHTTQEDLRAWRAGLAAVPVDRLPPPTR